jgi:hypothetical protein
MFRLLRNPPARLRRFRECAKGFVTIISFQEFASKFWSAISTVGVKADGANIRRFSLAPCVRLERHLEPSAVVSMPTASSAAV